MSILDRIGARFGARALRRYPKGRMPNRPLRAFSQIKSIGMIVPGEDQLRFNLLMDYAFSLRQQGKNVFVCTYYGKRPVPGYLSARRDVTLLLRGDLSWTFRPNSAASKAFCNEPFDYLIDFTMAAELPLQWVLRLSHASLSVGFRDVESVDIHFSLPVGADVSVQTAILERYLNGQDATQRGA